jgi:hypothetical protein
VWPLKEWPWFWAEVAVTAWWDPGNTEHNVDRTSFIMQPRNLRCLRRGPEQEQNCRTTDKDEIKVNQKASTTREINGLRLHVHNYTGTYSNYGKIGNYDADFMTDLFTLRYIIKKFFISEC